MQIEYRYGDVLQSDVKHIMHGCNSHGIMGSGVAAAIRSKYPTAYADYRSEYDRNGLQLGQVVESFQFDHGVVIWNAITQRDFGRDPNRVYVSYWAIAEALRWVENSRPNLTEFAMPMIGAGLGGGNWSVISAIIENTLTRVKPIVYILE